MKRIVLTGGPGAGKTVIARRIATQDPDRFVLVPEAATHIYSQSQTRWDRLGTAGRCEMQRRIYHWQIVQEDRIATDNPGKILLLDRGTIDGAAYWPEGSDAYWRDLHSSLSKELKRYDAVIWLQTAAAIRIYDGSDSNACRFEDAASAVISGQILDHLWHGHPNYHKIDACPQLEDKVQSVRQLLLRIAQ
jgi:predicted ATPase